MPRHRLASVSDVPPGAGKELVVEGRIVALFNVDGTFYALDGVCPHAGGPLGQGMLRKNIVTCPWHGWQFDVTTGRHCLTAHIRARPYEVNVEGDDVYIEIPAT
jgi:nitrite reductase/ring-hydroxylating ferredoxin subunit